jgi:hypothetical protein
VRRKAGTEAKLWEPRRQHLRGPCGRRYVGGGAGQAIFVPIETVALVIKDPTKYSKGSKCDDALWEARSPADPAEGYRARITPRSPRTGAPQMRPGPEKMLWNNSTKAFRSPALQAGGSGFESPCLHHKEGPGMRKRSPGPFPCPHLHGGSRISGSCAPAPSVWVGPARGPGVSPWAWRNPPCPASR